MSKRACLIGCGEIGAGFDSSGSSDIITHAHAIQRHPELELAACYDQSRLAAQNCSEKWGGCKVLDSLDEIFDSNYDLYAIASSTGSHAELLERALASNAAYIVCEKPLVATSQELKRLAPLLKNTHKKVLINFMRRFDCGHRKVAELLQSGNLGELYYFHGDVGRGVIHNGSHMIDLLQMFFGAVVSLKELNLHPEYDDLSGSLEVELPNHKTGIIQSRMQVPYSWFELEMVFTEGCLRLRDIGYTIEVFRPQPSKRYRGFKELVLDQNIESQLNTVIYNVYEELLSENFDGTALLEDVIDAANLFFDLQQRLENV